MARGKILQEPKTMPQPTLEELLPVLPETDGVWTWEEAAMSMPYSNLRGWIRILRYQRRSGRHVFQGPPGLSEKMEARWLSSKAPGTTSPPSARFTRD
jgi:hypothetical protein